MPIEQSDTPVAGQSAGQSPELDRLGRRRHPGQFPKGRSGNPSGKPKQEEPEEDEDDDGLSTAARMRKVFSQSKARDRGPAEKLLRQLIESDLDKYLSRLTAAERAERSGGRDDHPPTDDQSVPADEGTNRALEMARRCLAELAAQHAEKGECPECGSKLPAGRPITTNGVHR